MDPPAGKASQSCDSVRVAVNVRPLITHELLMGCTDCVTVVPGEPQVQIGSHAFTYDHVYGSSGSPSSAIYEGCVAPLADALFNGYNATVLAYGQTGSGKTYTMGTNYSGDEKVEGIIPKVMEHIFQKVESKNSTTEFLIRVSFIEILKEEVFDLLDPSQVAARGEATAKSMGPGRIPIQIRETANGGIMLVGVTEAEVSSKQEMASFLARGSLSRATASTNMNNQSSRSHAIFTISMEMKSRNSGNGSGPDEDCDDILCAKLHLVDLAGSERAKRTGAGGLRLKEGIHINRGLLALGNVISALGDEKKRKEGLHQHVPYRDSKLTRLLQDSLGGNSKTVMIACVSPADTNAEETINTLKYANRARNIQNKAVVNRDPVNAQMQKMRSQIEQLQAELLSSRGGHSSHDEHQVLQHKIQLLETRNTELCQELSTRQLACESLEKRALEAQLEKDMLILRFESFKNGRPQTESDDGDNIQDFDLVKTYVSRIQDLEMKLLRTENLSNSRRNAFLDCLDLEDDDVQTKNDLPGLHDNSSCRDDGDHEKEVEHSNLQDTFGRELQELNKQLEQKEEEMKKISTPDTSVLRQHYERKILEMEQEKKALHKEIENLQGMLANISLTSDDGAQKLKQEYLRKLNALETQVSELKKKQDAQSQVLRQKQRSEEASKRLQEEIQRIKTQKVQLQHKIKQESEQFRLWKASREKEVLQLKKEGRRNEYEMHKLLALNQRQKMVLQRKTEEASLATKRLKELLEAKKTYRESSSGPGTANGSGIQALIQAIEHELEVTVRVHEVRSQYARQLEARSAMANELSKLKDEALLMQKNMSDSHALSPSARNSRITALENMLATSSSTLVTMASQLSEAEERERGFAGRGRWNQVRSLPEAKSLMNSLFELASSSRCQLRDVEIASREKDSVTKDLKEKILSLNLTVKQLEAQKAELISLEKPKAPRKSTVFNTNVNTALEEDMDLSESELSDQDCSETESDEDWVDSRKRMPRKRSRVAACSGRSLAYSEQKLDVQKIQKLEILDEAEEREEAAAGSEQKICCSCSKYSLCKTKKCECRAANGFCQPSCGCRSSKCSNREGATKNDESEETPSPSESLEQSDSERTSTLAHQGALLLQSALSEKSAAKNEEKLGTRGRRPLSDIGNKTGNSTAAKPTKRKNWRKSVVRIVPVVSLPKNPPETKTNDGGVRENEPPRLRETLPLKLPPAMAARGKKKSHPLAERNSSSNSNNHTGSHRLTKDSEEKENGRE